MKKSLPLFLLLLSTNVFFAQDGSLETVVPQGSPATVFGGSADAYYKYDFTKVTDGYTSFTNTDNSFELGMVSLEASHSWEKASVFVDLGFGSRAQQFTYNDSPYTFMIKQLTFTYEVSPELKFIGGAFGTHVGYELLDAVDNKNYSMSYAFTYGPFYNTGVKGVYTKNKFSLMLGITNPTDFKSALETGTDAKTYIGQVAYVGDTGSAYLNFSTGASNGTPRMDIDENLLPSDEDKTQFDFVATRKFGNKFGLGFNATYSNTSNNLDSDLDGEWFSLVLYPTYAFTPKLLLAYRFEYFDANSATAGLGALTGSSVIGNTLSLNYKVGNLTLIPEFRIDAASNDIYVETDDVLNSTNIYALVAATYTF